MDDNSCPQWLAGFAWEVNSTIRQHDAMPVFREMLETWMADMEAQGDRLSDWGRRYAQYVEKVRETPKLRDSRAYLGNSVNGETDGGLKWFPLADSGKQLWCWMPAEFRVQPETRPRYVFPLPLPADRGLSVAERYAALAVVHDLCCDGQEKISPWPKPGPSAERQDEKRHYMYQMLLDQIGELKENDLPALKALLNETEHEIAESERKPGRTVEELGWFLAVVFRPINGMRLSGEWEDLSPRESWVFYRVATKETAEQTASVLRQSFDNRLFQVHQVSEFNAEDRRMCNLDIKRLADFSSGAKQVPDSRRVLDAMNYYRMAQEYEAELAREANASPPRDGETTQQDGALGADTPADAHGPATKTDWRKVQARLIRLYEAGEAYAPQRDLADRMKCSESTVNKAINASGELKAWMKRQRTPSLKAQSLNDVVTDNTASQREEDPGDALPTDEVDGIMHHLIEQAETPEERAKLNELNNEGRLKTAKLYQEHQKDKYLEDDAPGGNRIPDRKP